MLTVSERIDRFLPRAVPPSYDTGENITSGAELIKSSRLRQVAQFQLCAFFFFESLQKNTLLCKCTFYHTFIYIDAYPGVAEFSAPLHVSSHCQYFICDVCCATICLFFCGFFFFFGGDGPVISICLCYACRCFSFLRSSLKSCYPVSFAYRAFDVWPPRQRRLLLRPRRNGALFSVLSRHSSCHFSVAAASCERSGGGGYLAAISGFIFLRYLPGLSSCCRPGVIAHRNQGGDLSP